MSRESKPSDDGMEDELNILPPPSLFDHLHPLARHHEAMSSSLRDILELIATYVSSHLS